jgi:hypothetical protein
MDQTVVDVTEIPGVVPGDEAVLLGRQDGQEHHSGGTRRVGGDDSLGDFYRDCGKGGKTGNRNSSCGPPIEDRW